MTTALERITQLSGLSGVSAAQHLKQIAGAAGIAGALLVAFSGLPTGTAAEHLLANAVPEQAQSGGAGKGKVSRGHEVKQRAITYKLPEAPVTVYNGVGATVAKYVSSETATVKPDFTVRAPEFAALLETLAKPVSVNLESDAQSGQTVDAAFVAVQAGGVVQTGQEIAHRIVLSVEAVKIEKVAIAKARRDDDELALMMILAELV